MKAKRFKLYGRDLYQVNLIGHPNGVYSVDIDRDGNVYDCMVSDDNPEGDLIRRWVDVPDMEIPPEVAAAILDEVPKVQALFILKDNQ